MKKIKKGNIPSGLASFENKNAMGSWQEFRDTQKGVSYQQTRYQATADQGGLCAYCEVHHKGETGLFSIEHFHPKADKSNPNKNWALDWNNMLAVCRGGREEDKSIYPTPANLSCDAHKDHLKNQQAILNPLNLLAHKYFSFNKGTGELEVDKNITNEDLKEKIKKTIHVLNLNCYRLCVTRLEILKAYNRSMKIAQQYNQRTIKQDLAVRWFSKAWPSFFTTRRCLLGDTAERYLQSIHFDG